MRQKSWKIPFKHRLKGKGTLLATQLEDPCSKLDNYTSFPANRSQFLRSLSLPIKNKPTKKPFLPSSLARKPSWHENKTFLFPSISGREAPRLLLLFRGFSIHQAESTQGFITCRGFKICCQCFLEHQRAKKPTGFKQGWHCILRKLPAEQEQGEPRMWGNRERHIKTGKS